MKTLPYRYFFIWAIVLAVLGRFYFVLTVPLLENDSVVNLAYAKTFVENILVGRFVELAAAVGSIYLTYLMGARFRIL